MIRKNHTVKCHPPTYIQALNLSNALMVVFMKYNEHQKMCMEPQNILK